MPDWKSTERLVRTIAKNYKLPYFTISPTYAICPDHGYINDEQFNCPIYKKPAKVYSRMTGYYRSVQNWNVGKVQEYQEYKDRKLYQEKDSTNALRV